jgi:stearoyl-CoA desaturase (Delta-9 desaturase)
MRFSIFGIRSSDIHWVPFVFIVGYHVALLFALPWYLMATSPPAGLLWGTAALWVMNLLSITTGYHRLYAHSTYQTNRVVELFFLFWGTVAGEGSALKWAHDHRIHHRHVDTELDPYGTPRGFWQSHCLWMFGKQAEWQPRIVKDLTANPIVVFQDRYYGLLFTVSQVLVVWIGGLLTGDLVGAFVFLFLVRLFLVHHCTWFINSLAHIWGSKPYSTEHSAVNNFILALLTFGEGYHNYHHTFAGDYRNGVRWYQFDPPKWIIWAMSKMGWASSVRRVNRLTVKRRLLLADKKLMLEHLEQVVHGEAERLKERIEHVFDSIAESITDLKTATEHYRKLKGQTGEEVDAMKEKIRSYRKSLSEDMRAWRDLLNHVLELQPAMV